MRQNFQIIQKSSVLNKSFMKLICLKELNILLFFNPKLCFFISTDFDSKSSFLKHLHYPHYILFFLIKNRNYNNFFLFKVRPYPHKITTSFLLKFRCFPWKVMTPFSFFVTYFLQKCQLSSHTFFPSVWRSGRRTGRRMLSWVIMDLLRSGPGEESMFVWWEVCLHEQISASRQACRTWSVSPLKHFWGDVRFRTIVALPLLVGPRYRDPPR